LRLENARRNENALCRSLVSFQRKSDMTALAQCCRNVAKELKLPRLQKSVIVKETSLAGIEVIYS
jgi:ribosomal protein L18E